MSSQKKQSEAAAWAAHARELAAWAKATLVNRRDIYGGQYTDRNGVVQRTTWHDGLNRRRLVRHFAAGATEDVIGLHTPAPDEATLWVAWDIDAHPGQAFDAEANFGLAMRITDEARAAGLAVRLTDSSGGKGGFHVWAPFARPVPMADARRLGLWLVRHHAAFGFAKPPEVFPKSDRLSGKRCGSWLRLPGRHHKRPAWSRVWSSRRGAWRDGDRAVDALLSLTGKPVDVAAIVPADFTGRKPRPPVARRPERHRRAGSGDRDVCAAREALTHYPNKDLPYDDWLRIGMALRSLDDEVTAFELWDDWSAGSDKYDADVTAAKWDSFQPAGAWGGVSLGSLIRLAMDASNWPGPAYAVEVDPRGLRRFTHRSGRRGMVVVPARTVGGE